MICGSSGFRTQSDEARHTLGVYPSKYVLLPIGHNLTILRGFVRMIWMEE